MTSSALFVFDDGTTPTVQQVPLSGLHGNGDTLVRIHWSAINYKDALAVSGTGKIVRGSFPFVPGIDMAGEVVSSESDLWQPGDAVLMTGWGLGETMWGGYSTFQKLPSDKLLRIPDGFSMRHAMIAGTAGLTAMLGVLALERHGRAPSAGDVLVTGSSGGVGSFAVMALSHAGFNVVAATGSPDAGDYLRALGASDVVGRQQFEEGAARPLDSARWSGAIDSVGGATLANILSTTDRHGCVAACGLVGGHDLSTTVFPFILRGIQLIGIDSNTCPNDLREVAWSRLADLAGHHDMDAMSRTVRLDQIPEACQDVLSGRSRGRLVVDLTT